MGNASYRFLIAFFDAFLWLIVFINFLGWSGGYINIGQGQSVNWTNSYFGFTSIRTMITALNSAMNTAYGGIFKLSNFKRDFEQLGNVITFGAPKLIDAIISNKINLVEIGKLILTILGQPLLFLGYSVKVIAYIIHYVISFISVLFMALGGRFNMPFTQPLPSPIIL